MAKRKKKNRFEFLRKIWRKWETPPPPKEKFLLRKRIAQEWREISITELLIWFSTFVSVEHLAEYLSSWLGAIVVDVVVVLLSRSILRNTEQRLFAFWEWFAILVYTAISIHANINYYQSHGELEPYIKGGLWPFSVLVLTLVKTSAIRLFNVRRIKYTERAEKQTQDEKVLTREEKNRIKSKERYHKNKALGLLPDRKKQKTGSVFLAAFPEPTEKPKERKHKKEKIEKPQEQKEDRSKKRWTI
jgi:hypothetical protein